MSQGHDKLIDGLIRHANMMQADEVRPDVRALFSNAVAELMRQAAAILEQMGKAEPAAKAAHQCLTDWMVYYAPDQFESWRIEETDIRIRDNGGWLAYTSIVLQLLE